MDVNTSIWFLVYPQRSGSTFLATQLQKYASTILVVPETRIVEFLFAEDSNHKFSRQEIEQIVKHDHQIANLALSEIDIASFIDNSIDSTAVGVLVNLIAILEERAGNKTQVVIVKLGTQIYNVKNLRHHFGIVRLLAIYRDPRGVVNSLLSNVRPNFPGEKMGRGDVWFATKRWNKFMMALSGAIGQPWVTTIVVGYEELIENTQPCLKRITGELGIGRNVRPDKGTALDLREKERDIHKLVNMPSQMARIDGWRMELKTYQGITIELLAHEEMERMGYYIYYCRGIGAIKKYGSLMRCYMQHMGISANHMLRRAVYYLRRPALTMLRIKVRRSRK